ncbi:MAG: FAD-dependent oxidoreductase, partial [Dehalococcoidia bacterium]
GCSIAYHLAKGGASVVILERESVGCEASGVATGAISIMAIDLPGPFLDLAKASSELYETLAPELQETSGIDFHYGELSRLYLAFTEEEEEDNRATMSWKTGLGPKVSWLNADDIRRVEPRISPEARSGLFFEGMTQADAYSLTLAFTRAAESLGATFKYAEATGLATKEGKVTGVATPNGVIGCDAAVIAMGAWTGYVEPWIGMPVPVEPLKGQIIQLQAPGPPLACTLNHGSDYVTSKLDGSILAGAFDGLEGFDKRISEQGRRHIMKEVLKICPAMQDATVVADLVGLRPSTRDELPIMGPVPGLEGAYVATGHRRKGITLAAITGETMAQLVLGEQPRVPLEPFSLARFSNDADAPE